jgi:hypothetical protein
MAADPIWLARYAAVSDGCLYHVAPVRLQQAIETGGLIPWDQSGQGSRFDDEYEPRRGHVYLAAGRCIEYLDEPWVAFSVNIAALDPELINPDEDAFIETHLDPAVASRVRRFKLPCPECSVTGLAPLPGMCRPGPRHATYGQWAQAVDLGSDVQHTRESIERFGSCAYAGPIAPSALRLLDRSPHPHLALSPVT